ncbi:uncharacterized protein LOC122372932 [Amphibalanus amphitrite]|uniref:uncharacterized protein LOC122372932 n=1 Tax=Amphibalanus amphitrite TaxID=1232801 RepID=UPI001C907A40|nr:uncharacterized protein LOC122372932 [Amphibalanus amphitrite]
MGQLTMRLTREKPQHPCVILGKQSQNLPIRYKGEAPCGYISYEQGTSVKRPLRPQFAAMKTTLVLVCLVAVASARPQFIPGFGRPSAFGSAGANGIQAQTQGLFGSTTQIQQLGTTAQGGAFNGGSNLSQGTATLSQGIGPFGGAQQFGNTGAFSNQFTG